MKYITTTNALLYGYGSATVEETVVREMELRTHGNDAPKLSPTVVLAKLIQLLVEKNQLTIEEVGSQLFNDSDWQVSFEDEPWER
jgi:hypothetical protein